MRGSFGTSARALGIGVALLALLGARTAGATQIRYASESLGGSLWTYHYEVENDDVFFAASTTGFSVLFDPSLYANLVPQTSDAGWDVLVLQPDPGLPAAGLYDALALLDFGFGSVSHFSMSFEWLGEVGSEPGSQPWEVYAVDGLGFVTPLQAGTTVPVPEAGSGSLVFTGLLILVLTRRRR